MNRFPLLSILATAVLFSTGCAGPRIAQQRLVGQPDMVFSSSQIWNYDQPLALQTESGRAFAGGGSAAGCTSCK